LKGHEASDFGDICAAACLAHDIGNPPFGHSGEDAIRHWAETADYGKHRVAVLSDSQREDFLNFEGNAQGFRVITRLQNRDNPGGLQLTCATLAAFTKYPRESCIGKGRFHGVSAKKPGFTAQDQGNFQAVAKAVGLIRRDPVLAIWHRHPLAFLVEAADDICYRVIDIEDGYRLGHLSFYEAMELFSAILANSPVHESRLKRIRGDKEKVEFLRAKVISQVISEVLTCFLDHEEEILKGVFEEPLMSHIPHKEEMDRLIEVAGEKIYIAPEVIEIETAGFQVISELLERFIPIVDDVAQHGLKATPRSQMMIRLIPEQFIGPNAVPAKDDYTRLLRLTDFVSGMTDSYAVSLYKKVTGISLPG
jgi:dGTPase